MALRTRSVAFAACLLAALGCRGNVAVDQTSNQPQAKEPATAGDGAIPARPKIVALGDSLTAGMGLLESQAYPAVLQNILDREGYAYEVVNAGVSGDTTAGGLRRLEWAIAGDVRVLILALGANDGLRGLPVADMKRNLEQMVRRAKKRNIVVILAGMEALPNYGAEYTASFRQVFQDVARTERVLFLPFLLSKVAGDAELNQGDGIHPNTRGTAVLADTVWQALRPVLDQLPSSS